MDTEGTSVVCDTHALVWYLTDPERLSRLATDALEAAVDSGVIISSVSLIELVYASEKRNDPISATERLAVFAAMDNPLSPFTLAPVDTAVARTMGGITVRHPDEEGIRPVKDPFDRTILATAIALDLKLVTADRHLLRYHSDRCTW